MNNLKPQYTLNITADILYRLDAYDKTNKDKLIILDKVRGITSNRIEGKKIEKSVLH